MKPAGFGAREQELPGETAHGKAIPELESVVHVKHRPFHGWYIVAVAFLSLFVGASTSGFTFSILLPAMNVDLGWSRTTIVLGAGLSGVTAAVVGPWVGRLVDKRGPRLVMVISIICLGASLAASGLVTSPWQFYLAYGIVSGVSRSALISVAPGALIANWFVRRRATAFGIAAVGPPVSNLIVPPVLAAVIGLFGWRAGWVALGLVPVVIGLAPVLLFVRRRPEDMGLLPDGDSPIEPAFARAGREPLTRSKDWTAAEAFHSTAFWILATGMALILLAPNVTVVFMFSYLNSKGLDPTAAAVTISALSALQVLSRIVMWTPAVARLGVQRVLIVWGCLLSFASVVMAMAPDQNWAYGASALLGLSMGGNLVLQLQIWPEYFGRTAVGAVLGAGQLVQGMSSAIVPLALAALLDRTGSYGQLYGIVAGLVFVGVLLHLKIGQPMRPPHKGLASVL